ncbi:MAG: SDR family oxidoreductase [Candidatus Aminicenantes bacterium]|jgi:NAD(P)-dependent dehydrogenase (short-subunit alcohol dehydrogenase family)
MTEKKPLAGKVSVITGATSGIGEATAFALAEKGATTVIISRDEGKCRNTRNRIIKETGSQDVAYLVADLSSQDQIRELADEYQEKYQRLDVLVNNAGAFFWGRRESVDGIEMSFALNHLNYFLLTNALLDTIKESAPSRIINVSSGAHRGQEMDFEDINLTDGYQAMKAYGRSKLANVLFTYELAQRLEGTGVTVNAVHPGFVDTNFAREGQSPLRFLILLTQLFAQSPEKGAETVIYLASSPEVAGVTGKYFKDKEPVASSPEGYNRQAATRLWELSAAMTDLI